MEAVIKIKNIVLLYLDNLSLSISFDKKHPKVILEIKTLLDKFDFDDSTLPSYYGSMEKALGKLKRAIYLLNEHPIESYDNFSSLTPNYVLDIENKLKTINLLYNQLVKDINDKYDIDIVSIKSNLNFDKLHDYAKSNNVILDITKGLKHEPLVERIKDEILVYEPYTRPNIITTLYNLSSHQKDFNTFFDIKPFELTTHYFNRLSSRYKVNIIVINLTKKSNYDYDTLKNISKVLDDEAVKMNITIRPSQPSPILEADEVSYYPSTKTYDKYLVLKVGGRNYVMANYRDPMYPKHAFVDLMEHNRVYNYNSIIEKEFIKKDIIKKIPYINIVEHIPLQQLKYEILMALEKSKSPKSWIKIITKTVSKQITRIFGIKIYEYISIFEDFTNQVTSEIDKLNKQEEENKKDIMKSKRVRTIKEVVEEDLFLPHRNIYKEIRDNLEEF